MVYDSFLDRLHLGHQISNQSKYISYRPFDQEKCMWDFMINIYLQSWTVVDVYATLNSLSTK